MTKTQMLLVADLLELAEEKFANSGCSDYEIKDTPENREWLIQCEMADDETLNREQAEELAINSQSGKLLTMDWFLMQNLARQIRREVAQ